MRRRPAHAWGPILSACLAGLVAIWPAAAHAQPAPASAVASAAAGKKPAPAKASAGPSWSDLKPSEQAALKPLQGEWSSIDDLGKRKWIQIAQRYPAMHPSDQARLQDRMTEWAKLTPQERGKVRLQFLEAKKIQATDPQADWHAYQSLSADERKALAARAASVASAPRTMPKGVDAVTHTAPARHGVHPPGAGAAHPAAQAPAAPAKPLTPTLVQGAPGATTVLITKHQPSAPRQPASSARIAATPDVVDKTTLLPRAGAQSAQPRPAAASTPAAQQ